MFLVWAATGIWHGASWNFIAWGLFYFVLLTIEKNFDEIPEKGQSLAAHLHAVLCGTGLGHLYGQSARRTAGLAAAKLFVPQGGIAPLYYLRNYGVLLALGCVCSSTLPSWLWAKISKTRRPSSLCLRC